MGAGVARGFGGSPLAWARGRGRGIARRRGEERDEGWWWIYLYIYCRNSRDGWGKGELLAVRALYYIIGGHFGPPKLLSEHKKYEVLLGPPFFRAASGAAPPDRTVTEKGGTKERLACVKAGR